MLSQGSGYTFGLNRVAESRRVEAVQAALGGLASGVILSSWDYLGVGTLGVALISLPILVMLIQRLRPVPAAAA